MKITRLEIRNYRSIRELMLAPESLCALVGRNNSGKSNVLHALQLFFDASTRGLSADCYCGHDTSKPIEIFVTFNDLSDWEREQFGAWLDEESLTVGRRITFSGGDTYSIASIARVQRPEPDWLREDCITGDAIKTWWADRASLSVQGLDFGALLGTKKPTVAQWTEAASAFVHDHLAAIPMVVSELENPKGYPGVLKGALPEFVYVPAVRDVTDEAKVAKTNPFGQLVNSVLEKITEERVLLISDRLNEVKRILNRGSEERLQEVAEIEERLNTLMHDIMDCDIEIEMGVPEVQEVFGAARVFVDDGVRTPVEAKGHGLQRSMIFTILRAYAEVAHIRKAGEKAAERSTIFAVEEPELYLHPQSQRTVMAVFRQISEGRDQIFYSTQSSLFVDVAHFDEICIMRREEDDGQLVSNPTQLSMDTMLVDLKCRKGITGTPEGMREQYSNAFDPTVNEGLFGDRVVIVEGASELYALPVFARALGYDFDRANVAVVQAGSKGPMDRLLRIFNGFGIPTYLVFDGDRNNNDAEVKRKTMELLALVGSPIDRIEDVVTAVSDSHTVFESTYEDALKAEVPGFDDLASDASAALGPCGKPLMHRFVARRLAAEERVPALIAELIDRIKHVEYYGSMLETPDEAKEGAQGV